VSDHKARKASADDLLAETLSRMLSEHFTDIPHPEEIEVGVGRRSRRRLGTVRRGPNGPSITINPLLLLDGVPEYVLDATMAHELCHVVHGYGTLHRPKHPPHRGGRVTAELRARGLHAMTDRADAWIRSQWTNWYETHAADLAAARTARLEERAQMWRAFLGQPGVRSAQDLYRWSDALALRLSVQPIRGVEWLHAGTRQRRLSYCRTRDWIVLLHGVLAHASVPESVLRYELAAWLQYLTTRHDRGTHFSIEQAMSEHEIAEAQHWRRYCWSRFRTKHSPG